MLRLAPRAAGLALAIAVTGALPAGIAAAQEAPGVTVRSPILTIDPEAVFARSALGRRLAREIEAEQQALASENRRIEAELTAEELALTEQRASLPIDEFRALADAFDAKVQRVRREQDAKEAALERRAERAEAEFLRATRPVLAEVMQERGAAVILDRRSVFVAFGAIDVTDAAIVAIDAALGAQGAEPPRPPEDPSAEPPDAPLLPSEQ